VRGRLRPQCGEDCFKNAFEISSHVIIPKAENAIPMLAEPLISDSIALAPRVLATIHFNNEPVLTTDKVSDVTTDRLLANELDAVQFPRAKPSPKLGFGNRGVFAKPSG
jgi:hypothetical protein